MYQCTIERTGGPPLRVVSGSRSVIEGVARTAAERVVSMGIQDCNAVLPNVELVTLISAAAVRDSLSGLFRLLDHFGEPHSIHRTEAEGGAALTSYASARLDLASPGRLTGIVLERGGRVVLLDPHFRSLLPRLNRRLAAKSIRLVPASMVSVTQGTRVELFEPQSSPRDLAGLITVDFKPHRAHSSALVRNAGQWARRLFTISDTDLALACALARSAPIHETWGAATAADLVEAIDSMFDSRLG